MRQATLTITDEVNVRISGLELDMRRRLHNRFKYDIPHARYLPAVRLGRWDGKMAFFNLGGSTYVNLLPEILPMLEESGYDVELDDQREYRTYFEFQEVTQSSFSHIVWPEPHRFAGQPIELRPDQVEAINIFLTNPQSIQCLATGFGKTILTAVLSQRCEQYGRTLVIVPSKDLVKQTEADYINMGLDVGVFFGDRKEHTQRHIICTWQSLNSLFKNTKNGEPQISFNEFIDGMVCVMVDECHGLKATALKELMVGPLSRIPIRWAITGTIPKEECEKASLRVSVGDVVGTVKASELQEKGILSDCHIYIRQLVDYGEYKQYQDELKYLLEDRDRLSYIAGMIQEISKSGNTLVLIDRVEPGKQLVEMIPDSVFLSGSTKSKVRKEQYDTVAFTDNRVIVATYGIAAVGINIVRLYNIVLIEPGKSFVRVIQSIGRGLRKGNDKDSVNIIDVTSTCKFSKRHLTKRKQYYTEADYEFSIERVDWQSNK